MSADQTEPNREQNTLDQPCYTIEQTKKKLFEQRQAKIKIKQKDLIKISGDKLNEFLKLYFQTCKIGEENSEESKEAFELINREWKAYCSRLNSTQKLITVQYQAFEENVPRIIQETNARIAAKKEMQESSVEEFNNTLKVVKDEE